ncbi:transposase [Escherichia coli]|nr:transposase [Escherichia coli]
MPLLLREQYGVGPVCSELHIAPSTYYHCQQQRYHPYKRSACAQHDDWLKKEILRLYDENHQVYGGVKSDVSCYRKVSGWPDV